MDSQTELPTPQSFEVRPVRRWKRIPSDVKEVHVSLTREGEFDAEVVNWSYGGLSVRVAAPTPVELSEEVEVLYDGSPIRGVVRYLKAECDQVQIGIEWLNE